MNQSVRIIVLIPLCLVTLVACACISTEPPTEWSRCEGADKSIVVDCPINSQVVEHELGVQFTNSEVNLSEGKIEQLITILYLYGKDSSGLSLAVPSEVDKSDPLAVMTAIRDHLEKSWGEQFHEIEPPKEVSFNNRPGAVIVVNRIDSGEEDIFGPVNIVYYYAIILLEDDVIWIQTQARKHMGGDILPVYSERIVNSIEIR